MPPRELIVITDDRERSALPEVVANLSVRVVDWYDTSRLAFTGDAPVLLDIDLHDIRKVKLVKDNVPSRIGDQCRIIVVDRASRLCEAQANGLGASELLRRPLDIQQLTAYLRRRLMRLDIVSDADQELLEREPGGASIVSAAAVLDRMFTALAHGGPLDMASVVQSGDRVLDAIAEVGLAKWLGTVRSHHEGTFQHCLLVTGILTAFGHKNGMRRSDVLTLTIAGLLHDIGKAQISIDILDKPGNLNNEEFQIIKQHPTIGYEYLRTQRCIRSEILRAVRSHHEYLDGSGYPDGLLASQIDDLTRIMTICDVYGALTERRAYKAPKKPALALDILKDMARNGKVEYDLVRALGHCVSA
jgi:putative nucleotidyltransferase with HDIG domain